MSAAQRNWKPRKPFVIDARSDMYLAAYQGELRQQFKAPVLRVETQRFARTFRNVWRSLSEADRRLMREHWAKEPNPWNGQRLPDNRRVYPALRLVDGSGLPRWVVASCKAPGHSIYFNAYQMFIASDAYVAFVIAHELAHVFQHASDDPTAMSAGVRLKRYRRVRDRNPGADGATLARKYARADRDMYRRSERGAEQIAGRWGYPDTPLEFRPDFLSFVGQRITSPSATTPGAD
jgi:hypothetical protein